MECVQWDQGYNLGIEEIDYQHQGLIDIMNELCDAIDSGKEISVINKILDDLNQYADEHFGLEEKYFDMFHYQKTDEHKTQHNEFRKKIADLRSKLENDKKSVSTDTMVFIGEWFVKHTQTSDREYVDLFHENGVY